MPVLQERQIEQVREYSKGILRVCLGCFFFLSGATKIISLEAFEDVTRGYGILPEVMILPVASLICVSEMSLGTLLLLNIWSRSASAVLIVLVVCFTALSGGMYFLGYISDCGCFGKIIERRNGILMMVQNLSIIVLLSFFTLRHNGKHY